MPGPQSAAITVIGGERVLDSVGLCSGASHRVISFSNRLCAFVHDPIILCLSTHNTLHQSQRRLHQLEESNGEFPHIRMI